jgi:acetyl/propionyl-CoA carboxylase alpha subunit
VATTIFVTSDASTWTALVDEPHVSLAEAGGAFLVEPQDDGRWRITGPAGTNTASAVKAGDVVWVGINGHVIELRANSAAAARPVVRDDDSLAPPMSATVVKIHVRPGDRVPAGATLVTLEAMKMEMSIKAPRAATVSAIHCKEGTLAPAGLPVVTLLDD